MNLVRRIAPRHIRKLTENELCHRIRFQVPALHYRQQLPGNFEWPSFVWNGSSAPNTCTRSTSWSSPDARRTESKKLRSASQSSGDSRFIIGQSSMNSFFRPGVTKRARRMRPKNIRAVCVPRDSPPPALSSWIRQTAALNETAANWCPK